MEGNKDFEWELDISDGLKYKLVLQQSVTERTDNLANWKLLIQKERKLMLFVT